MQLGEALIDVVQAYTPDSHMPLLLAIGHAGPESSNDLPTLAGARRAGRGNRGQGGAFVGPRRRRTRRTARHRDRARGHPPARPAGRGPARWARRATRSPRSPATSPPDWASRARSVCSSASVPTSPMSATRSAASPDGNPQEIGARLVGATAGPFVAAALRHVNERWDGAGTPDGLSRTVHSRGSTDRCRGRCAGALRIRHLGHRRGVRDALRPDRRRGGGRTGPSAQLTDPTPR